MRRRDAPPIPLPVQFSREEFLSNRWRYRPGEHVTILAPTQAGKTTLAFELLKRTASPELPAIVLVMKPRDAVVSRWGEQLDYRRVQTWPPTLPMIRSKPPGYLVWPKHQFDASDDARMATVFADALQDSYKRGNRIVFADEMLGLIEELGLKSRVTPLWTRGASMGCGFWTATQRPFAIPQHAYSSAEHLFLGRDPDKRNRQRYTEIGGIDPELLDAAVTRLKKYQWLYVRRSGPVYCVIDSK